jgi:hypothetical protein
MERPAAVTALRAAVTNSHLTKDASHITFVVDDRPYVCPPLAGSWTRITSGRFTNGRIQLRWGLCTYRPQMRVNDGVWTWRRASIGPTRNGPLAVDVEMKEEGRVWATSLGLAYLPVELAQILECRKARAIDMLTRLAGRAP